MRIFKSLGVRPLISRLGPGLITGAADDDPSGIATYSQVGAQFGYKLGWSIVLSLPCMIVVQEISARLGSVTGKGLAAAIRAQMPRWFLYLVVALLAVANIINLGADIGAMASSFKLLVGGSEHIYAILVAVFCAACEVWLAYKRYVSILKFLTLSLFAYVALLLVIQIPLGEVLAGALLPRFTLDSATLTAITAVFGTTISPYLFFWQAATEAEDRQLCPGPNTIGSKSDAAPEFRRIRIDTIVGMSFSNLVALSILIGTAATLHANGVTDIQTSAQAAEALRPIAGDFAFAIFAAGIIGTGLLAVPVLAGSLAYAIGEAFDWQTGLSRQAVEAKWFYSVIVIATLLGAAIVFSPIDPIKALFWSAVINGVLAGPIIATMVMLCSRRAVMGDMVLPFSMRAMGWLTALCMAAAAVAMIVL